MTENKTLPSWGNYRQTGLRTRLARILTTLGLGRGPVRKQIIKLWLHDCVDGLVDKEVHGLKYRLDIKHNTTDKKLLTSSKIYDAEELNFLSDSSGSKKGCFIDIGANTGYYSLTLAKCGFDKIIAIEPNPPTLIRLKMNIALNGLDHTILVAPYCVGEQGKIPFYCSGGFGVASAIRKAGVDPIWVESRPLLDIISSNKIQSIDAMKIDVEGFEDQALHPFFKEVPPPLFPKRIVIEHCHKQDWRLDIIGYMQKQGYLIAGRNRSNIFLHLPF
jgi:FkbM family methyltransferase